MIRRGVVQTVYVGVAAIEEDAVRLVGGQQRAVLEVGSLSFGLQDEREQEAILASFAAFLNSLTFRVQILVRAVPIDVDGYLADLERRARDLSAELGELAYDHVAFVRRLSRTRTLLERRFYLVVPASDEAVGARRLFGRPAARQDADAARRQLSARCDEVERQLGRCGLAARRLSGGAIARLFQACWCPELARVQRLDRDLSHATALVVRTRNREDGRF